MKKTKLKKVGLAICIILIFFTYCVDTSYDLGNVDYTIHIGGENLTFPFGDTKNMFLREFIKLQDSEMLDTLATGEYFLKKEGQIDVFNLSVSKFTINGPTVTLDKALVFPQPKAISEGVQPINNEEINVSGKFMMEKRNVPGEILTVTTFNMRNGNATMTLNFVFTGPVYAIERIDLEDLKMYFPKFIVFESGQRGIEDNMISFKGENFYPAIQTKYSRTFNIESFDFNTVSERGISVSRNRIFTVNDVISLEGIIRSFNTNLNQVGENIELICIIEIEDLPVNYLSGEIYLVVDISETLIDFEDIPDFLKDDDVIMDVAEQAVIFNVDNNMNLPVRLFSGMVGIRNNKPTHEKTVRTGDESTGPMLAPPNRFTIFSLSEREANDLFSVVPEIIHLDMDAESYRGEEYTVILGKEYKFELDYKMDLLLSFKSGANIVYRDTLRGLNKDIGKYEFTKLSISADVENAIPLQLLIEITAIDAETKEISNIEVKVNNGEVISPYISESVPSTTPILIELNAEPGAMKKLDGIILRIYANPTEDTDGLPLKSFQYLTFKNMKTTIIGGVKIDLN